MLSAPAIDDHRPGPRARWLSQVAASDLGTVFYTPGGAAGWALDFVLRVYFACARRRPPRRT
jgi:hypothetical protein